MYNENKNYIFPTLRQKADLKSSLLYKTCYQLVSKTSTEKNLNFSNLYG